MSARLKVLPVRSAWGRIQGWAVNRGDREIAFLPIFTRETPEATRALALTYAQRLARMENPDV
ncbi:hypothetical protein [Mycolicibacterium fortuitum]